MAKDNSTLSIVENHPWVFENAQTALEQMPIDWVFMLASPNAINNYKVVPPRWHSVGATPMSLWIL